MNQSNLQSVLGVSYARLVGIRDAFQEKGVKHFTRPLLFGAVLICGSYGLIYRSSADSLRNVRVDLRALQATVQYATEYQNLRARLQSVYGRLPKAKDPGIWLLSEVRESLRKEGIVPTSFSTPTEASVEGYRIIYIRVVCHAHYKEIASWVARVESNSSFLYIKDLSLEKKEEPIGVNEISATVGTVLPEQGAL